MTGALTYEASTKVVAAADVLGAWIHRGAEGERGGALPGLLGRQEAQGTGTIMVPPADYQRLKEGRYYLAIYTRDAPYGRRAQIVIR